MKNISDCFISTHFYGIIESYGGVMMNFFKNIPCNDDFGCTSIENLFLSKYMVDAPGDFIKVYLLGLKYSQSLDPTVQTIGRIASNEHFAKTLSLHTSVVMDAWRYWESHGIINVNSVEHGNDDDMNIEFLSIRNLFFSKGSTANSPIDMDTPSNNPTKSSADRITSAMEDKHKREMFDCVKQLTGKLTTSTEILNILDWIDAYNFDPFLIIRLVEECVNQGYTNIQTMNKMAKIWYDNKIDTQEKAELFILKRKNSKMFDSIAKLLNRDLDKDDIQEFRKLMDNYYFSADLIIHLVEYCVNLDKANMPYIVSTAGYWYQDGIKNVNGAIAYQNKYYDTLRRYEVISKLLNCGTAVSGTREIMNKWITTFHTTDEMIKLGAEHLQTYTKPTVARMDALLTKWHQEGIDTLEKAQANLNSTRSFNKEQKKKVTSTPDAKSGFNNFKNRVYDADALKAQLLRNNRGDRND